MTSEPSNSREDVIPPQGDDDQANATALQIQGCQILRTSRRTDITPPLFIDHLHMWSLQQRQDSEACCYKSKQVGRHPLQRLLWQAPRHTVSDGCMDWRGFGELELVVSRIEHPEKLT